MSAEAATGAMARRRSELDADGRREQLLVAVQEKGVGVVLAALQEGATQLLDICREQGPAALLELVGAAEVARDVWAQRCKLAQGSIDSAREGQAALDSFALEASAALGEAFEQLDGGARGGKRQKAERALVAEELGIDTKKVSDLRKLAKLTDEQRAGAAEALRDEGRRLTPKAVLSFAKATSKAKGHDSAQYYTPPRLLRAFEKGHGIEQFDVDLCSCLFAQAKNVKARRWHCLVGTFEVGKGEKRREVEYLAPDTPEAQAEALAQGLTKKEIAAAVKAFGGAGGVEVRKLSADDETEGRRLTQDPAGHVFTQPDYGDPGPAVLSTVEAYNCGKGLVKAATILLNTATSSEAQQAILKVAASVSIGVCFFSKGKDHSRTRVAFVGPDGAEKDSNDRDQIAFYLGPDVQRWCMAMAGWGTAVPIEMAYHDAPEKAAPKPAKPKAKAKAKRKAPPKASKRRAS